MATWIKANPLDKKTMPNSNTMVYIRYGHGEKDLGYDTLIIELVENGWENVRWLDETESTPTVPVSVEKRAQAYADDLYKEYAGKGTPEGDIAVIQKKRDCIQDYISGFEAATSQPSSPVPEDVKEAAENSSENYASIVEGGMYKKGSGEFANAKNDYTQGFLAGHAYKGQQGENAKVKIEGPFPIDEGKEQYVASMDLYQISTVGSTKQEAFWELMKSFAVLCMYHSKENFAPLQPAIPLSVIEALTDANPYKDDSSITFDSDTGKALENKRIGYWKAVSKLRELLSKNGE